MNTIGKVFVRLRNLTIYTDLVLKVLLYPGGDLRMDVSLKSRNKNITEYKFSVFKKLKEE